MNVIKDNYPEGVCPDCRTLIPDDAVDGTECKNCGHIFHSNNTIKYKVLLHWNGHFTKYLPIEGEVDTEGRTIQEVLEKIFYQEQEYKGRKFPSVSELDIIELDDGRRFRILDKGFNELCSKLEHISCDICSKFYVAREDTPKSTHMKVRNTFYKGSRNNVCDKCFREYGIK